MSSLELDSCCLHRVPDSLLKGWARGESKGLEAGTVMC